MSARQTAKPAIAARLTPRRGRATGRVTITDVAQAANVSPMTVSRALKSPELVQQKSRDRIAAVVKKLGYVPNQAASTLASAKSQVIGVIVPSLTNAVFIDTLSGIRECLSQAGYQFLIGKAAIRRTRKASWYQPIWHMRRTAFC